MLSKTKPKEKIQCRNHDEGLPGQEVAAEVTTLYQRFKCIFFLVISLDATSFIQSFTSVNDGFIGDLHHEA